VEENEDLENAAVRELKEETGISNVILRQIGAFGKPGRDPRGPTVTIAYAGEAPYGAKVEGMDDAAKAEWFDLTDLPALAFDHQEILQKALNDLYV
jgi:8-oxo-dGTP diphosphatase